MLWWLPMRGRRGWTTGWWYGVVGGGGGVVGEKE